MSFDVRRLLWWWLAWLVQIFSSSMVFSFFREAVPINPEVNAKFSSCQSAYVCGVEFSNRCGKMRSDSLGTRPGSLANIIDVCPQFNRSQHLHWHLHSICEEKPLPVSINYAFGKIFAVARGDCTRRNAIRSGTRITRESVTPTLKRAYGRFNCRGHYEQPGWDFFPFADGELRGDEEGMSASECFRNGLYSPPLRQGWVLPVSLSKSALSPHS